MADDSRIMSFHSSIARVASMIKNNKIKKVEDQSEMEKKKRERKANYSIEETHRLVGLIIARKDILENKKNGADQWQEKKQAWEEIESEFNQCSDGSVYRDFKNLKAKYESLKRDIKKKWSNQLAGRRDSNGKLPKFTSAEKRVKEILQLPVAEGFCDFNSMNDNTDDDDDSNSSTDSIIKDTNWSQNDSAVKREIVHTDEEEPNFETKSLSNEPLSDGEPQSKKLHEDPLVGKQNLTHKSDGREKRLMDEKLEATRLQNDLLREEIEVKKLQRKIMEEDLVHKREIHELEKQHLLLKIEALKGGGITNNTI